jgi:hypothetical protein
MRRTPASAAVLFTLAMVFASMAVLDSPAAGTSTAAPTVDAARAVGAPPANYVPTSRAYFSYPNRKKSERMVIRNRVLNTIKSTWGGRRTPAGLARAGNGTIRIVTWSFNDWQVARALVAARNRGASVQIVAAQSANKGNKPWRYLRKKLGGRLYQPGHKNTRELVSFARSCRGACRGPGGTAHAKYFLFDRVGARRARSVVFNTSMNLTRFAYTNQWNQAQVMKNGAVYNDFISVFRQARIGRPVSGPYHVKNFGNVADYFFPRPGARAAQDPVMSILGRTHCAGAASGGNRAHKTKIRIIQYAMYGDRGLWLAKKLRNLWGLGCDIRLIYGVTSRPVLQVLRSRSGRGKVPMRQSVIKNGSGEIVKYNHSKWMTITGRYGSSRSTWLTFTGSANWALLAFASDEQMQRVYSRSQALFYLNAFNTTWGQKTSKLPPGGRVASFGRGTATPGVPEGEPDWGRGVYRYMQP